MYFFLSLIIKKIENQLTDRVRGEKEILENVPVALLLNFSPFLIISQMKKEKKYGFFARLLQALAKGVSAYLCYWD